MLKPGTALPTLALEDTAGAARPIPDANDPSATLLYFMRSTSCAICNAHVRDLGKRASEFEASNVRVMIAVPESRAEALAWKEARSIPLPVVVGRDDTPHAAVGLSTKVFGTLQASGSVLVSASGLVVHAHGATMPPMAYDRKGIDAAIRTLAAPPHHQDRAGVPAPRDASPHPSTAA